MAEQYINMDKLAVGYNGKALIHDICIGIEKGEIVTLIGPNGAGKSTILKSITPPVKDHFRKCDYCRRKPDQTVFP